MSGGCIAAERMLVTWCISPKSGVISFYLIDGSSSCCLVLSHTCIPIILKLAFWIAGF